MPVLCVHREAVEVGDLALGTEALLSRLSPDMAGSERTPMIFIVQRHDKKRDERGVGIGVQKGGTFDARVDILISRKNIATGLIGKTSVCRRWDW